MSCSFDHGNLVRIRVRERHADDILASCLPAERASLHILISIVRIPLELVGFTIRETAHVAEAIIQFLFRKLDA